MEHEVKPKPDMVRTTVMVSTDLDAAIRELADANGRPLSWEVRRALESHVKRERRKAAA